MNDFHFDVGISRNDIANELSNNDEGLVWVLNWLPEIVDVEALCEAINDLSPNEKKTSEFYQLVSQAFGENQ